MEDICSIPCKISLFGVYRFNKWLQLNQKELKVLDDELKQSKIAFSKKLNEATTEIEILKTSLYQRNVKVDYNRKIDFVSI